MVFGWCAFTKFNLGFEFRFAHIQKAMLWPNEQELCLIKKKRAYRQNSRWALGNVRKLSIEPPKCFVHSFRSSTELHARSERLKCLNGNLSEALGISVQVLQMFSNDQNDFTRSRCTARLRKTKVHRAGSLKLLMISRHDNTPTMFSSTNVFIEIKFKFHRLKELFLIMQL